MPKITIDVLDLGNPRAKVGKGPITTAYDVEHDDPLSAAGQFSFKVPCRDAKSAYLVTQQRSVDIYADQALIFSGIVEQKRRVVPSNGAAYFDISGYSLARELADETVGFLALASGSAGVTNAPATVLATHSKGWSLDSTNGYSTTTNSYYGRMVGPSVLKALTRLQERTAEHWIYRPSLSGDDRKIIWLRAAGTASGYRAIAHAGDAKALEANPYVMPITDFEEIEDGFELINRVYLYGAGQDLERTAINIEPTTRTSDSIYTISAANNYVQYAPSGYGYRLREVMLQFEDIAPISNTVPDMEAAADMLVDAGKRYLARRAVLGKFYRLRVLKVPADLLPSQTVRVVIKEIRLSTGEVIHDIDTDLFVLNIKSKYTPGGAIYDLEVASVDRHPSIDDGDEAYTELEKAQLAQSHTQIGPTVYTPSFDEDFDDTTAAELVFWMGAEIAQVQQVLLRFKIEPLHSTVKTVGGSSTSTGPSSATSSGASSATSSGASSSSTTGGGGGTTVSSNNSSGSISGSTGPNLAAGDPHAHNYTLVPHTHDVVLLDHTHGMEHTHNIEHDHNIEHTHDVTAAITATYGIYTETDGGKIIRTDNVGNLTTDMTLTINGGAPSGSIAASSASGYWEIDLTDDLIDIAGGTYRPDQEVNTIELVAASGKTGRVKAQLLIRASIQAVANL